MDGARGGRVWSVVDVWRLCSRWRGVDVTDRDSRGGAIVDRRCDVYITSINCVLWDV